MGRSTDHVKAREKLAKLPAESLCSSTVRLPAWLMIEVHKRGELRKLDFTRAVQELLTVGVEQIGHNGPPVNIDHKEMVRCQREVDRALKAGYSPFEPFLYEDKPNLEALASIMARLDYPAMYKELLAMNQEPRLERLWKHLKTIAPSHLRPLMVGLDQLEKRFLVRKRLNEAKPEEGGIAQVQWLMSDAIMQILNSSALDKVDADIDIESVRRLINARYLVASYPDRPWTFVWEG